jgi:hypothetical protein
MNKCRSTATNTERAERPYILEHVSWNAQLQAMSSKQIFINFEQAGIHWNNSGSRKNSHAKRIPENAPFRIRAQQNCTHDLKHADHFDSLTHNFTTIIPVYKLAFNEPGRWYRRVTTDLEITMHCFKILYQQASENAYESTTIITGQD